MTMALGFNLNFRYYYILSLGFLPLILNQTTETQLFYCVDFSCEEFISRGKTLLNYNGKTEQHLSFRQNEDIKILGKPVDIDGPDWVATVRRKVGLVPKSMVREDQVAKRSPTYKFPLNQLPCWQQREVEENNINVSVPNPASTLDEEIDLVNDTLSDTTTTPTESSAAAAGLEDKNEVETESHSEAGKEEVDAEEGGSPVTDPTQDVLKGLEDTRDDKVEDIKSVQPQPPGNEDIKPVQPGYEDINSVTTGAPAPSLSQLEEDTPNDTVTERPVVNEQIEPIKEQGLESGIGSTTDPSESVEVVGGDTEIKSNEKEEGSPLPPVDGNVIGTTTSPLEVEVIEVNPVTESPVVVLQEQVETDSETSKTVEQKEISPPIESPEILPVLEDSQAKETDSPQDINNVNGPPVTATEEDVPKEPIPTESPVGDEKVEANSEADKEKKVAEQQDNAAAAAPSPTETETVPEGTQGLGGATETKDTENISPPYIDIPVSTESPPPASPAEHVSAESQAPDVDSGNSPNLEIKVDVEVPSPSPEIIKEEEESISPSDQDLRIDTPGTIPTENSVVDEKREADADKELEPEGEMPPPIAPYPVESDKEAADETKAEDKHEQDVGVEVNVFTTQSPVEVEVEQVPSESPPDQETDLEKVPPVPSKMDVSFTNTVDVEGGQHDHSHSDHDHHGHHHHHHSHSEDTTRDTSSSSFIIIAKHLSSTLLSFLPEHLQDTILDVDDALVFTGIIALTLVSICVPYFLIEGFFSVRPLKKKVVELNKSLWKVSTAYENQQEEFEQYKKKALAYDEDKKRVEQLEYELVLLKKLEGKQKEQVVKYQKELKNHKELTQDMQSFLDKEVEKKKKILEEKEKLKTSVTSLKEALRRTVEDLQDTQTQSSTTVMELELERQSNETLFKKCGMLEREVGELKNKLVSEVDRRRSVENEKDELEKVRSGVENELSSLKQICQQYEDTVSALNTEISNKENELFALQETLGEDSPLMDVAEVKGKLLNVEEQLSSVQNRLDSTTLENASLSRNLKEATASLSSIQKERDDNANRLLVLEAWFKEKEEDLRKAVERYEAEKNIRGKDKDELVQMLEDKGEENRQLHIKLDEFKVEFEETKLQHKNEIRAMETKSHEHWLSLCQAERKAQDARKEAEMLRQKLTAITKEKESDGMNGDESTAMYPLITPDMVPIPLPDDVVPSYFGLGDGFMPPPPLPLDDDDREVHRPAPLGRVSPTYSDIDDAISPIRGGGGRDYSDGGQSSASDSPRRRPSPRRRGGSGWSRDRDRDRQRQQDMEDMRHREFGERRPGPVTTSSPIQGGFNL